MKGASKKALAMFICFFSLGLALVACKPPGNTANGSSASAANSGVEQLCRKIEACGCGSYADCMSQVPNSPSLKDPAVVECMLKSSCESLCAAKPDACFGTPGGTTGGGTSPGQPGRSNCSQIRCSRNSDCPSDCYGGCDGVICYSF